MRALAITLVTIVLGTPTLARAGVISVDWESSGDGLLTRDTLNKREWLDLTETAGVRLADVMTHMTPGGRLEGFRFASLDDATRLAASADVGEWIWSLPFRVDPHAVELVNHLGWVVHLSGGVLPDIYVANGLVAANSTAGLPTFDDTNFYVFSVPPLPIPPNDNPLIFRDPPAGGVLTDGPLWPELALGIGDIGPFWMYRSIPEPAIVHLLVQLLTASIGVRCYRRFVAA